MKREPYLKEVKDTVRSIEIASAWRVEGTLREFAKFPPRNMWFSYPVHEVDTTGVLADIQLEDAAPGWKKNLKKGPESKKKTTEKNKEKLVNAIQVLDDGMEPVTIDDIVEYFSTEDKPISEKTIRRWIKNSEIFEVKNGKIHQKNT